MYIFKEREHEEYKIYVETYSDSRKRILSILFSLLYLLKLIDFRFLHNAIKIVIIFPRNYERMYSHAMIC